MKPLHATDYLWEPSKYPVSGICVLFGSETFLKYEVMKHLRNEILGDEDAEFSFTRFEGPTLALPRLLEELATVAMFGGGRRLVLVEDADAFITKFRPELEDYADSPSAANLLMLQTQTFPANTKLFKKVAAQGMVIDCNGMNEPQCADWIVRWSKLRHQTPIDSAAATLIVQLVGTEIGLINQELAKLALLADDKGITTELVAKGVGSWRSRTTFEMLDLALAGKSGEAIRQLSQLFAAGENPVGILAQIAYSLRKLAAATRLIQDSEAAGKKLTVAAALTQLGVNKFFLSRMEQQLKMLGRRRGGHLLSWLLEADLDLKGGSRADPRLILERFIIRLSARRDDRLGS